jgi:DeoR family transcriptional regulator of aga operon
VVTNAINIGMELCNQPRIRTYLTGGAVPWAWSFSLTGPTAVESLNGVYMDKVFLGVIGLDVARGATTGEADEALTFRTMLEHGKQVIAVADSTKLGHVSPALICPISNIHVLITDTGASDDVVAEFAKRGIRVIRA